MFAMLIKTRTFILVPSYSSFIDLRSDTVTRPTPEMFRFMMNAPLGDDVFDDDPTVHALQNKLASMLGKEAGMMMIIVLFI